MAQWQKVNVMYKTLVCNNKSTVSLQKPFGCINAPKPAYEEGPGQKRPERPEAVPVLLGLGPRQFIRAFNNSISCT